VFMSGGPKRDHKMGLGAFLPSLLGILLGAFSLFFVEVERETGFEPATLSLEG
jgi:hypothetical protein